MPLVSDDGEVVYVSLYCHWPGSEQGKRFTPKPTAVYWWDPEKKALSGLQLSSGAVISAPLPADFFESCTVRELCEWIQDVPREKYASTLLARVMENPSGFRSDLKTIDSLRSMEEAKRIAESGSSGALGRRNNPSGNDAETASSPSPVDARKLIRCLRLGLPFESEDGMPMNGVSRPTFSRPESIYGGNRSTVGVAVTKKKRGWPKGRTRGSRKTVPQSDGKDVVAMANAVSHDGNHLDVLLFLINQAGVDECEAMLEQVSGLIDAEMAWCCGGEEDGTHSRLMERFVGLYHFLNDIRNAKKEEGGTC